MSHQENKHPVPGSDKLELVRNILFIVLMYDLGLIFLATICLLDHMHLWLSKMWPFLLAALVLIINIIILSFGIRMNLNKEIEKLEQKQLQRRNK